MVPLAVQVLPCGWAVWVLSFNCLKVLTTKPLYEEQTSQVSWRWRLGETVS